MEMTEKQNDTRSKLLSHFSSCKNTSDHGQLWDALWKEGFYPWDNGAPNPALIDFLSERQDLLAVSQKSVKKRALVPGCGKGYDVLLLAAYGYDAYGLEISETALEFAKTLEKDTRDSEIYMKRSGVSKIGEIKWVTGNFFGKEFLKEVGEGIKFDLIYDYTFFCALHPTMRPAWSNRMMELLSEDGRLLCVEFPTYKPHSTGGPPWASPPNVYYAHLTRPGKDLNYSENEGLLKDELEEPSEIHLRQIAHFRPDRTQPIGYDADGNVTDWIGVWAHSDQTKN